jgi:hypothetical protein
MKASNFSARYSKIEPDWKMETGCDPLRSTSAGIVVLGAFPAQAAFIATLEQSGANAVATGSATIDLTDLSFIGWGNGLGGYISPSDTQIVLGIDIGYVIYGNVLEPAPFGGGGFTPSKHEHRRLRRLYYPLT